MAVAVIGLFISHGNGVPSVLGYAGQVGLVGRFAAVMPAIPQLAGIRQQMDAVVSRADGHGRTLFCDICITGRRILAYIKQYGKCRCLEQAGSIVERCIIAVLIVPMGCHLNGLAAAIHLGSRSASSQGQAIAFF